MILIPTVNTKSEPSEMFEWELRVQAGDVIAKADDKEQILYVDIALEHSTKTREMKPYTQLRRTDLYI